MAKRAQDRAQKRRAKRLVEQQAERRKTSVYRFEVTFSTGDSEHVYMADFLTDLPRGGASQFIREAVIEKMARELVDELPRPASEDFADMLRAIADKVDSLPQFAEVHDMMASIKDDTAQLVSRPVMAAIYPPPAPERPPTLPEQSGAVQSGGIDMSRPRPRPKAKVIDAPKAEPITEELSEQDAIRLAKIMANSIKRAQPGRTL